MDDETKDPAARELHRIEGRMHAVKEARERLIAAFRECQRALEQYNDAVMDASPGGRANMPFDFIDPPSVDPATIEDPIIPGYDDLMRREKLEGIPLTPQEVRKFLRRR